MSTQIISLTVLSNANSTYVAPLRISHIYRVTQKVSHFQESILNRIKTAKFSSVSGIK